MPGRRGRAGEVRNVMTKSMNARAQSEGPGTIWHNSGGTDRPAGSPPPVRPAEAVVRLAPVVSLPVPPVPPMVRACRLLDGWIAGSSLASNEPVLDVRDFGWTDALRRDWSAIRDEALTLAVEGTPPPAPCGIIPLWRNGRALDDRIAACPRTAEALAAVPGLHDAGFALLAPGAHVAPPRGATKALISCHLGLVVPRDGGARMRVRDRIVRWAEGQTLVFDDTFPHEVWNEAEAMRLVLRLRFVRPLRQPGRGIANGILRLFGAML